MFDFLPNSIIPWLLGGLLLLVLFALSVTFKSWREAKRSPYFFMRMQAGKKMQRYLVVSFVLILMTVAASAYAWQDPEETVALVGVLKHAKPSLGTFDTAPEQESIVEEAPGAITISLTPVAVREVTISAVDLLENQEQPLAVSETANQVESDVSGPVDAQLGNVSFSTDISGSYQAIDPGNRFLEGFYTLYATFSYQGMADGVNWSWSWLRNGAQIEGGSQVWNYGEEGPGYIFFRPEEGFRAGEYSLAIWVNEELQSQNGFTVAEGVAASN